MCISQSYGLCLWFATLGARTFPGVGSAAAAPAIGPGKVSIPAQPVRINTAPCMRQFLEHALHYAHGKLLTYRRKQAVYCWVIGSWIKDEGF